MKKGDSVEQMSYAPAPHLDGEGANPCMAGGSGYRDQKGNVDITR